ncbi:MAG TPA: glycosyltransferase [Phycisphaerae bacterium]|nr:glycosyltransferase [Phycisphaerae bacterium]HNU44001.1 glycosyltransferase [Phycisphaerae bacterium]
MTTVCHVFDESVGWVQRVGVRPLLDSGCRAYPAPRLFAIDPAAGEALRPLGKSVTFSPRRFGLDLLAAPRLGVLLREHGTELVHAWGIHAAAAVRSALGRDQPLVISICDPALPPAAVKLLRALLGDARGAVACGSGVVRRRLVEGGAPSERCVLLRPAVDFAVINAVRGQSRSALLGAAADVTVVLLAEPLCAGHDHFEAFWAVVLRGHLRGGLRVVVPGSSRVAARIARFATGLPDPGVLLVPPDGTPFEHLVACADLLVVPARRDLDPTAIAWAMAAGVPIVAAAVPAVAEFIVHKVNGYLYKPEAGRGLFRVLARLLEDRPEAPRCAEAGRGQAYEMFSARRYVEQTWQLYSNVIAGRRPDADIPDPASAATGQC